MATKKKSSKKREPGYRRQKGAHGDRAFVELGGQRHYLGEYGSKESRTKYHRLLAEWNSCGGLPPARAGELSVVRWSLLLPGRELFRGHVGAL